MHSRNFVLATLNNKLRFILQCVLKLLAYLYNIWLINPRLEQTGGQTDGR